VSRLLERLPEVGLYAAAVAAVSVLFMVVVVIGLQGLFDMGVLIGSHQLLMEVGLTYALQPLDLLNPLVGTVLVALGSLVLSLPVGVGCALWIAYLAPRPRRRQATAALRMMADIPPVVYGFVGLVAVAPPLAWLFGLQDGRSGVIACLILGTMSLPTVALYTLRALREVPDRLIDSAVALGATRMQAVWWVALPAVWRGLCAAGLLAALRGVSDTMVVLLVAGEGSFRGWMGPIDTLTRFLTRAVDPGQPTGLFAAAVLLLAMGFTLHWLATRVGGTT